MNKKNLVLSLALLSSSVALVNADAASDAAATKAAADAAKAAAEKAVADATAAAVKANTELGTATDALNKLNGNDTYWAAFKSMPANSYNAVKANPKLVAAVAIAAVAATIAIQALVNKSSDDVDAEEAL